MPEEMKKSPEQITPTEEAKKEEAPLNEDWAMDAKMDLEDFIEEQGIYIRQ